MFAWINRLLEWFKSLFWKEEMELTLVGLQVSQETTYYTHQISSFKNYCQSIIVVPNNIATFIIQHAGKTTFVNVIASGSFNEDMIPTVGFNMRKITKGNVTIKLWDIGGQVSPQLLNNSQQINLRLLFNYCFSFHCI